MKKFFYASINKNTHFYRFCNSITLWSFGVDILGAEGTGISSGAQNTRDIVAGCTTEVTAADVAAYTLNRYNDWFLPSKDELNKLFNYLAR